MVGLGIVLVIVGWLVKMNILTSIGVLLIIVGLILNFVPIGGARRRVW
ncbi:hypothetical protein [Mobilicoccus massiliensis]|nr:hypothetical protein [Mobilicoccus massiliensis]